LAEERNGGGEAPKAAKALPETVTPADSEAPAPAPTPAPNDAPALAPNDAPAPNEAPAPALRPNEAPAPNPAPAPPSANATGGERGTEGSMVCVVFVGKRMLSSPFDAASARPARGLPPRLAASVVGRSGLVGMSTAGCAGVFLASSRGNTSS